jgi:transposase
LLALAEIYEGGSRTRAARVGGVGLQTVRDWMVRFNAHGPEALIDGRAPGNACKFQACHREALLALVESGPIPAVHGVVRWRLKDLVQWVWDEFRIAVSQTTLAVNCGRSAIASSRPARAIMPRATPRWRFLERVPRACGGNRVQRGRWQAARDLVLLLDQAGWHVSRKLKVPANITLVPLPAKAPELNPVENIWQYMRENWISNRVFTSYMDILDHCCAAWNKLTDQPWTIMSIGLRDWANA